MKGRRLEFFHRNDESKCGGKVAVSLITLMEGWEIWFEGLCDVCGVHVRIRLPLEQLIFMTPNPQNRPFFKPPIQKQLTPEDEEFLKNLGIDPKNKKNKEDVN
jgi:hypothetical protein